MIYLRTTPNNVAQPPSAVKNIRSNPNSGTEPVSKGNEFMKLASALRKLAASCLFLAASQSWAEPATRNVQLSTTAVIDKLPADAHTIDLWMPIAQDTDGQKVLNFKVAYPEGGTVATEDRYGNKIWHRRFEAPFTRDLHENSLGAEIDFEIQRTEIVIQDAKSLVPVPKVKSDLLPYLEPNRLIPVDYEPIKKISTQLNLQAEPPIRAAHKVYDWLIDEFTYNWQAPGAGKGDVRWACDAKSGDCSDYASTFMSLMRLNGIPADHEFGFPIRTADHEGEIKHYHCWARFFVTGVGWIPVDISEADKHPELREYNFGSQTAGLMKFSHGRDVTLVPAQAGPPLNKFIYPYVEIDGQEHKDVTLLVHFKDLPN